MLKIFFLLLLYLAVPLTFWTINIMFTDETATFLSILKRFKYFIIMAIVVFILAYLWSVRQSKLLREDVDRTYASAFEISNVEIVPMDKQYDGIRILKNNDLQYRCLVYPIRPRKLREYSLDGYTFTKEANSTEIKGFKGNDTILFYMKYP